MLDKDAINKVADFLKPKDFYKVAHENVYQTIISLYSQGDPIDILGLTSRLQEKKQLQKIGGKEYLTELVNAVPTAAHIEYYAKIVKQKKVLRDLIGASTRITELAYGGEEEIEDILDRAEKSIFDVTNQGRRQNFVSVKEALQDAFSRIDQLHQNQDGLRGLPTGFYDLDGLLSGFQRSDFIVLAARPSLGKTALALNTARHAACEHKAPVGIFSIEMSKEQLVDRLLAAEANVNLWKIRTGKLSTTGEDNDFTKLQRAFGALTDAPLFIDDSGSNTVMQIRTMARRLQSEHGLGLIVVDYLQLMESPKHMESRVLEIGQISRSLKSLARELEVPVLALSQLSRGVEHRSPQVPKLADLRESGAIEQDADVVMFIYREDREKKDTERVNVADILIEKHRNGPTGQVELYFNEQTTSFEDLDTTHADYAPQMTQ